MTTQLYAYVAADGRFTYQGNELANLRTTKNLMNSENDEMSNRPAFGISEKAGSARVAFENLSTHLEKRTSLLNVDPMQRRLAAFLEALPALEKLDNAQGYERAAELTRGAARCLSAGQGSPLRHEEHPRHLPEGFKACCPETHSQ